MTFRVVQGRLYRDGEAFLPIGVDYYPSQAGCQLWTDWDGAAIRRDLRDVAAAGLNTVRLFVFWRDFEPAPGQYRTTAFDRLRAVVDHAGRAGLACVVSIFTIWMNGTRLDLPWRQGRSLWLDPSMLARQEAFAAAVAACLHGADNLLGFDLGDEISNVDPVDAAALHLDVVAAWHRRMAGALRAVLPSALIMQANDASAVFGATAFGVDNAAELDLIAVHGFPTWAPGSIESTESYKATNLVAFLAQVAAAYGAPFIDEFGSYGVAEQVAAGYLRAGAASALANGAAGLLVWCWQDIASTREPYDQRPGERFAGLRRLDGSARPTLGALQRVARAAAALTAPRAAAQVALYVPAHQRQAVGGTYLDPEPDMLPTFYAYLLLKRAHLDVGVVSSVPPGCPLVICPSVTRVSLSDLRRLRDFASAGGTVYYSMGEHLHGFPGAELAGVAPYDFDLVAAGKSAICWGRDSWPLDWSVAATRPATFLPVAGRTLASFPDGSPAVQLTEVGTGRFIFCAAPLERQLDRPGRLTEHDWPEIYRRVAEIAGVVPTVDCPAADQGAADLELIRYADAAEHRVLAINHSAHTVRTELIWRGGHGSVRRPLELAGKDWRILTGPAP